MGASGRVRALTPSRFHMKESSLYLDSKTPQTASRLAYTDPANCIANMENFQKLGAFGKNISCVDPARRGSRRSERSPEFANMASPVPPSRPLPQGRSSWSRRRLVRMSTRYVRYQETLRTPRASGAASMLTWCDRPNCPPTTSSSRSAWTR